jgi:DNA-cytosine methyltransferase
MRVLSLFDGISCARVALDRANIPISHYYACEIEKNAIKVSQRNYPDTIHLGSVVGLTPPFNIDLLVGGSPCTDLSIAKKDRKGLDGERSGLFWEYVRIKNEAKPKWFILENVASMSKEAKEAITKAMGVEPVMFNASLVSAQSRKRLFWTNIPFELPEDKGVLLKHILEDNVDKKFNVNGGGLGAKTGLYKVGRDIGRRINEQGHRADHDKSIATTRRVELRDDDKCGTLTSVQKDNLVVNENTIRKLTPIECERLQGLPDNYTEGIAMTNRYKCLGNAFNVDVVAHILAGVRK